MAAIPIFAVRKNSSFCESRAVIREIESKIVLAKIAKVAHLVEHDLAKVGVAGSSPVFRSNIQT